MYCNTAISVSYSFQHCYQHSTSHTVWLLSPGQPLPSGCKFLWLSEPGWLHFVGPSCRDRVLGRSALACRDRVLGRSALACRDRVLV